jgi:hypothetical protein
VLPPKEYVSFKLGELGKFIAMNSYSIILYLSELIEFNNDDARATCSSAAATAATCICLS